MWGLRYATRDFKDGGSVMKRFKKYKYLAIAYENKGLYSQNP